MIVDGFTGLGGQGSYYLLSNLTYQPDIGPCRTPLKGP